MLPITEMRGCLVSITIFGINICLSVACNGGMRVILIIEPLAIANISDLDK